MLNLPLLRYFFPKEVMFVFAEIVSVFEKYREAASRVVNSIVFDTKFSKVYTFEKEKILKRLGDEYVLSSALKWADRLDESTRVGSVSQKRCSVDDLNLLGISKEIFEYGLNIQDEYCVRCEVVVKLSPEHADYKSAKRVIGALAYDIRCSWACLVWDRIKKMYEIAEEYGVGMPEMTDVDVEDAESDGRYFRGQEWEGPYGHCFYEDLHSIGRDETIFEHPESVINDYVQTYSDE